MNTNELIGKSEAEAKRLITVEGLIPRVTRKDDDYFVGTCDLRMDRINLQIDNDKVVEVHIG